MNQSTFALAFNFIPDMSIANRIIRDCCWPHKVGFNILSFGNSMAIVISHPDFIPLNQVADNINEQFSIWEDYQLTAYENSHDLG